MDNKSPQLLLDFELEVDWDTPADPPAIPLPEPPLPVPRQRLHDALDALIEQKGLLPPANPSMQTAAKRLLFLPAPDGVQPRDTQFMRAIAFNPVEKWSERFCRAAWNVLGRYITQLSGIGIDYYRLKEPPRVDRQPAIRAVTTIDGAFVISFTWDRAVFDALRAGLNLGPADKHGAVWTFRVFAEPEGARFLLRVAGDVGLVIDDSAMSLCYQLMEQSEPQLARSRAINPAYLTDIPGFGLALYPFQLAGIEYIRDAKRCILGDEPGNGKTRQVLGVIGLEQAFPAIVVCPASVKEHWRREAQQAFPNRRVLVLDSKSTDYRADILVINYDILAGRTTTIRTGDGESHRRHYPGQGEKLLAHTRPKLVAWDEAHKLRNPKAKRTIECAELAELAEYRIAATGTPFVNRPKDAASLLNLIGQMDAVFQSERKFMARYCPGKGGKGAANLQELNANLRGTCFTGDTLVDCEYEQIPISEIVNRRLSVRVWSRDRLGRLSIQPVVGYSRKENRQPLVRVMHKHGTFICTPDHLIYTQQGYVRAGCLTSDHVLSTLRSVVHPPGKKSLQWLFSVLLSLLRRKGSLPKPESHSGINCDTRTEARPRHRKTLPLVRSVFLGQGYPFGKAQELLQQPMRFGGAIPPTGGCKPLAQQGSASETSSSDNRQAQSQDRIQAQGEEVRPGAEGRNEQGDERGVGATQEVRYKCRRLLDSESQEAGEGCSHKGAQLAAWCAGVAGRLGGIPVRRWWAHLLCGSGACAVPHCCRGGRIKSRAAVATDSGPAPRTTIRGSRVRHVEVLDLGHRGPTGLGPLSDPGVYDIEVDFNHNFFANGVLAHNCYVRRLKVEVLRDLPPKTRSVIPVELTAVGRVEYDKAEADLIAWMQEQEDKLDAIVAGTYKLAPGEKMPKVYNLRAAMAFQALMRITALRQLTAKYKTDAVKAWVDDFLESEEKLLVFAWHKEIVHDLSSTFRAPFITGDVPVRERQLIVDKFQTDEQCRLVVLNIEAGGVGLTMTAASNVLFHEMPWTPAELDQAIDRTHRIGQTKPVTAWILNAENTIDEEVYAAVERKRVITTAAADGATPEAAASVQHDVINRIRAKGGLKVIESEAADAA